MDGQLVAEIDGESVAFAMLRPGRGVSLDRVRRFRIDDFPTFTDALQAYTRENGIPTARLQMGLAVAGVSRGDVISLPNSRWFISVGGLRAFLGHEPLVINDFAATAWSVSTLDAARFTRIAGAAPRGVKPGIYLVVGTGPGLGMATLRIGRDGGTFVMESEGGHASFAPQSEREEALLQALRKRYAGHVSFERLLCRAGLQAIHECLPRRGGLQPPSLGNPDLIVAAAGRSDPVAQETMDAFFCAMGSFIGNAVLTVGAWDGVFLVGSMLEDMLPLIERSSLRNAMVAKGRMRRSLEAVPVSFAHSENGSLAGVAAALLARDGRVALAAAHTEIPILPSRPAAEAKRAAFM